MNGMLATSARRCVMMACHASSAPFTQAVVKSMRKLYPEDTADKSFDNTGLLLEAPFNPSKRQMNSVLLTIDLTKAVADEAIERQDSIIVAYHPIIFKALKSFTLANSQQQSLLRLAAAGISVYCPHTAVDTAPGGLSDFLADIVTGTALTGDKRASNAQRQFQNAERSRATPHTKAATRPSYVLQHHPSNPAVHIRAGDFKLASQPHTRTPITPSTNGPAIGRHIRFHKPQPLPDLIERIAAGLGHPAAFPVAIPQGSSTSDHTIHTVGVCAGSGGGLLNGLDDTDLLFTGELSHHEALAAIEQGRCVVTVFHSNSERGYLDAVLREQLRIEVEKQWHEMRSSRVDSKEEIEALSDERVTVDVSERDRDPYGIILNEVHEVNKS